MRLAYNKLILINKHYRYYTYEKPLFLGPKNEIKKYKNRTEEQILKISINRAKNKLIDLLQSNPEMTRFVTLTFAKSGLSLQDSNLIFRKFIKNLRYKYPNIKYLAVPELQNKRLQIRGEFAIHYHLLIDTFISLSTLNVLWPHGYTFIKHLKGTSQYASLYISKYITKDYINESRMIHPKDSHYYYYSKNLNKPITYYGYQAVLIYNFFQQQRIDLSTQCYNSEFTGQIESKKGYFNLSNLSQFYQEIEDLLYPQNYVILKSDESINIKIPIQSKLF